MRGKLRDKRTVNKREIFRRDLVERKRPASRRNNRSITWLEELEDENVETEITEEEKTSNKK